MVRFLIANGADVNLGDEFSTASMVAREKRVHAIPGIDSLLTVWWCHHHHIIIAELLPLIHSYMVRFLIANRADVNLGDDFSTASQVTRDKRVHAIPSIDSL